VSWDWEGTTTGEQAEGLEMPQGILRAEFALRILVATGEYERERQA
jgi:hypothetical protein